MAICLPKKNRDKLLTALKEKDITIDKLYDMSSAERSKMFEQYVGKDFSPFVNGKFEQAMVSNQKTAFSNWIKQTTSHKDPVRKDMLKKVNKVKDVLTPDEEMGFLEDLAGLKVGMNITEEEAKTIFNINERINSLKAKWNPKKAEAELFENAKNKSAGWASEEDRLAYGFALDDFKEFVRKIKQDAEAVSLLDRFKPANYGKNIIDLAGATKSMVASFDNSFIGRQGIKTLLRGDIKTWTKTALDSFKFFGKDLVAKSGGLFKERSDATMRAIKADIFSRPNAMNGKYKAAKSGYGLGVLHEEVFPSSLPQRIPILGRVFKASETAFSGSALRMRADLADAVIANAEKNGVDMLDEVQATAHAKVVGSMTGRGEIGRLGAVGEEVNALLFSVRFLKSNIDTLTAHQFDKAMTPEARKLAVKSTLKIASSITGLLGTAKLLGADVEFDPRSTRFGQICRGNHCYDITGGMRGLVTVGSRLFPTYHNGEWGFWSKSGVTGKWTKMTGDKYGERTALDTFEQFFEGKLSPGFGAIRDIWKGQNFQGEKPDFINTTIGLITPISVEQMIDELQKGNDDILIAMMAEAIGISPYETTMGGYGTKWRELKEKIDIKKYNQALKTVTDRFNKRAERLKKSSSWERMDYENQAEELQKIKREETERVFNRYGIR